jgi:EmrB/QacA subfamily drug resistance transporter
MEKVKTEWVDRRTGRWVLFATILASSMAFIDFSALNVALPAIQKSFEALGSQILWVVNGYNLMLASLILVGGTAGDRLGRKKMFMIGVSVFMGASMFCGFSPGIDFLIAGRIVQGIGGAFMVPGSLSIITASFGPDRRGSAIGTWSAVTTIMMVLGPVIGGFLSQAGLWRFIFFINVPLAAAALFALFLYVPESRDEGVSRRIDVTGAALATVSLVGLTYGFISAPNLGYGAPRVIVSLGVGFTAMAAFIIAEKKIANPLVSLDLFGSKTFSGANLLTLFLYGALSAYTLFVTLNMIQVQGYPESVAGFVLLPFVVLLAGLSRWSGKLVDRIGPRPFLIAGPSIVGVGFFLTSFAGLTAGPQDYWTSFFPPIFLFGLGMGFTVAPLTTTVMSALPTRFAGTASGINNATARVAGVLAIAILGSIALISFSNGVSELTAGMDLPQKARAELHNESLQFGDASVPPNVPQGLENRVQLSLDKAFVRSFALLMYICTGLAWLSALMSALLIKKGVFHSDEEFH